MRRLVISDIHGCNQTFRALIDRISLTKDDHLYLLGDYIDRGPDSSGVLDYILELQRKGYMLFPLRGNHEENLLRAYDEYDRATFEFYVKKFKSPDLLDEKGEIKLHFYTFFKQLPYFYLLDDYILVHAGVNFSIDNPFEDKVALLELRKTLYNEKKADGRKIVFGHQPREIEYIHNAIESNTPLIPLDNGCVYNKPHKIYDHTKMGNLLCINLDALELTMMENVD